MQELHRRAPHVGAHVDICTIAVPVPDPVQANAFGIAIGLGVRVVLAETLAFECVASGDETGSILPQTGRCHCQRESVVSRRPAAFRVQLALTIARFRAEAAVVGIIDGGDPWRAASERKYRTRTNIVVCAQFDTRIGLARICRLRHKYVDDTMKRVRPEQRIGRPTNHFDRAGLLGIYLDELIGIAKAGRPGRDSVFED